MTAAFKAVNKSFSIRWAHQSFTPKFSFDTKYHIVVVKARLASGSSFSESYPEASVNFSFNYPYEMLRRTKLCT
jgi:hypothetical protein